MSADFWAGYISGALGIVVGNPLDLIKTRLQAGSTPSIYISSNNATNTANEPVSWSRQVARWTALARGAAAPVLGYGALNALLFVTYNRSLALLSNGSFNVMPERPSGLNVFTAGALGGLATFCVSAPTELIKCRAQVGDSSMSSLAVARDVYRRSGIKGLYLGGGITSVRDAVGYGFYFWSYQLSKQAIAQDDSTRSGEAVRVLFCGGLAGIVTWASIFPLDVVKTRVQTWDLNSLVKVSSLQHEAASLLVADQSNQKSLINERPSTYRIARELYRSEGISVFFRGLGVCCARAFIVNAIQWAVYEWLMSQ